jgi:hypothetical protein
VALDDEHVGAAHRLPEAAVQLAVGELRQVGVAQRDAQAFGDLLGEGEVGPPRHQVQALLGDDFHPDSLIP